jgi:hypothetical protein
MADRWTGTVVGGAGTAGRRTTRLCTAITLLPHRAFLLIRTVMRNTTSPRFPTSFQHPCDRHKRTARFMGGENNHARVPYYKTLLQQTSAYLSSERVDDSVDGDDDIGIGELKGYVAEWINDGCGRTPNPDICMFTRSSLQGDMNRQVENAVGTEVVLYRVYALGRSSKWSVPDRCYSRVSIRAVSWSPGTDVGVWLHLPVLARAPGTGIDRV